MMIIIDDSGSRTSCPKVHHTCVTPPQVLPWWQVHLPVGSASRVSLFYQRRLIRSSASEACQLLWRRIWKILISTRHLDGWDLLGSRDANANVNLRAWLCDLLKCKFFQSSVVRLTEEPLCSIRLSHTRLSSNQAAGTSPCSRHQATGAVPLHQHTEASIVLSPSLALTSSHVNTSPLPRKSAKKFHHPFANVTAMGFRPLLSVHFASRVSSCLLFSIISSLLPPHMLWSSSFLSPPPLLLFSTLPIRLMYSLLFFFFNIHTKDSSQAHPYASLPFLPLSHFAGVVVIVITICSSTVWIFNYLHVLLFSLER